VLGGGGTCRGREGLGKRGSETPSPRRGGPLLHLHRLTAKGGKSGGGDRPQLTIPGNRTPSHPNARTQSFAGTLKFKFSVKLVAPVETLVGGRVGGGLAGVPWRHFVPGDAVNQEPRRRGGPGKETREPSAQTTPAKRRSFKKASLRFSQEKPNLLLKASFPGG